MFKTSFRIAALSLAVAAAPILSSTPAHAVNIVWVRNCTITAVVETDGQIQIAIVKNGTVEWLSMASSNAAAGRLLASATAAWLAGKKLDVKVDFDAAQGCGNQANCENVLGWMIKN